MLLLLLAVVILSINSMMTQQQLREQASAREWKPSVESGHVAGWSFLTSETGADLAEDDSYSSPTPNLMFEGFRPKGLRLRVGQTIDVNGGLVGIPFITDVPAAALSIEDSSGRIAIRHAAGLEENRRTRTVALVAGWPSGLLEELHIAPVDHKGVTIASNVVQTFADGRIIVIEVPTRRPGELEFLRVRARNVANALQNATTQAEIESLDAPRELPTDALGGPHPEPEERE